MKPLRGEHLLPPFAFLALSSTGSPPPHAQLPGADSSDNWIQLIESYSPPKDEAISYLSNGTSTAPTRYAHAMVHHGSTERIVDYLIGPLPISRHTTFRPLTENYHIDPIPLNSHATFNWTLLGENMARMIQPIDPIMRDLFNASLLDGTGEGGIVPAGVAPMGWDGSWRKIWVQFKRGGAGQWIRPLDLFIYVSRQPQSPPCVQCDRSGNGGTLNKLME